MTSLQDLSIETMVTLTASWLDPDHKANKALQLIPETQGKSGAIERCHAAVLHVQTIPPPRDKLLKSISDQLASADNAHDRKYRGIFKILDGLRDLTDEVEVLAAIDALRAHLFEVGLSGTLLSYRDEAGAARRAQERVTEADSELLGAIFVFHDQSLKDHHATLLQAANTLHELEDQRVAIQNSPANQPVTLTQVKQARNLWIRTVRSIESDLSLSAATDAQKADILGALNLEASKARAANLAARKKAAARNKAAKAADDEAAAKADDDTPQT